MKRSSRKWKKKNKSGYRGRWKWYRKKLKKKKPKKKREDEEFEPTLDIFEDGGNLQFNTPWGAVSLE